MLYDTTQYIKRLKLKFGVNPLVGSAIDHQTAVPHKCQKCKAIFLASPDVMLNHKEEPVCLTCSKKNTKKELTERAQFAAQLASKFPKIKCKKYGKLSSFKCGVCGHSWRLKPGYMLQKKHGCPKCAALIVYVPEPSDVSEKAVRYALKHTKVRGKITQHPESVQYMYLGELNEFYPAVEYKDTVVAVKSVGWLAKNIERMKAVNKACHKLGLRLRVLVGGVGEATNWLDWKNAEDVEQYVAQAARKTIRILALDPGTSNFGWSVLEVALPFKPRLLASGLVQRPVTEIIGQHVGDQIETLLREIGEIAQEFSIDHLIAERYMARGMKGSTIELVNCMLGALVARSSVKSQNIKLIPAAQWKNEFNRIYNLDEFYKSVNCVDHQADASLIGLYGAHVWYGVKPFTGMAAKVFAKQLNTHNLEPRQTK